MTNLTCGTGAKWMTQASTSTRGPTNGQGGGTTTIPTAFCDGVLEVPIYGILVTAVDAADSTITVMDARGVDITDDTTTTHKFEYVIKGGSVAPLRIPFGTRGILVPVRRFIARSATPWTWDSVAKTLTRTAHFTNYTFRAGDYVYVDSGTGLKPGNYPIASKASNDAITLADGTLGANAATDVVGAIIYGGGPTAKTSIVTTAFVLDFGLEGGARQMGSHKWMFVNSTSARHPTDGQGNSTATLSPVPNFGVGRSGARVYSFLCQTNHATVAQTLTIARTDGSAGFTVPIPPATSRVCPFTIDIGPPMLGRDFYNSLEGLFTAFVSDTSCTGQLFFDVGTDRLFY